MKFFRENTCLVEVEQFFSILDLSLDDIPGFFLDPNPVSSVFKFQFLPTSIPIWTEMFFFSLNLNLSLEIKNLAMLMPSSDHLIIPVVGKGRDQISFPPPKILPGRRLGVQ